MHDVKYYECRNCLYVQTQSPFWLDEAYRSPINITDTGLVYRNIENRFVTQAVLTLLRLRDGKVLDYAGGYGLLVRLLRDSGIDAYWQDQYSPNLLAMGFEMKDTDYDLVISYESFEHLLDPLDTAKSLFSKARNILISTALIPTPTPRPEDWWYYGTEHGQHIGFFRHKTLEYIADSLKTNFVSDGKSYHLFSQRKVSPYKWKLLLLLARYMPFIFNTSSRTYRISDSAKLASKT